jgi:hypothetical protein
MKPNSEIWAEVKEILRKADVSLGIQYAGEIDGRDKWLFALTDGDGFYIGEHFTAACRSPATPSAAEVLRKMLRDNDVDLMRNVFKTRELEAIREALGESE